MATLALRNCKELLLDHVSMFHLSRGTSLLGLPQLGLRFQGHFCTVNQSPPSSLQSSIHVVSDFTCSAHRRSVHCYVVFFVVVSISQSKTNGASPKVGTCRLKQACKKNQHETNARTPNLGCNACPSNLSTSSLTVHCKYYRQFRNLPTKIENTQAWQGCLAHFFAADFPIADLPIPPVHGHYQNLQQ